jgi:Ca2+-binding EF-hand superfamily protein
MPISIRYAVLIPCAISLSSVAYAQGQWSTVQLPGDHPEVFALAVHGAKQQLFIGTGGLPNARANAVGILWSGDHGTHVQPRAEGFRTTRFDLLIRSLHSCEGLLVAASADGPYFSEDDGATWHKRAEGLPVIRQTSMRSANALTSLDGVIFCGTPQGVYRTSDAGRHWIASSSGLSTLDVRALTRLGTVLFASTDGGGVCRSTDGGRSWQHASDGIPAGLRSRAILAADGVVLAGTTQGTFRSVDQGASWTPTLARANARSFAATDGLMAIGAFRGAGSVYVSQDQGEHWFDVSANLPRGGIGVWAMAFDDQYLYAAINRQGLWRIPRAELKSLLEPGNAAKPVAGGVRSQQPSTPSDSLLAVLDGDHDGELSGAEMDNAAAVLRALDKNGDGRLSGAELGRSSPRQQQGATAAKGQAAAPNRKRQGNAGVRANLLALDADGDGKLSRSEVPGRMQRIFDRADTDKNGSLDRAEIDKFAQQLGPGRGR